MPTAPDVSIIIPTFNDEEWVAAALESCIRQTAKNIEIICVDDASTDTTAAIIEKYRARDGRIRLIALEVNSSAFQARRAGVAAARADYVLFLDGDDELLPEAAQIALRRANATKADVVGFGVQVIMPDGTLRSSLSNALQPRHPELVGEEILPALFPQGRAVNGHLWRYLLRTELIHRVYEGLPRDLFVPRANDLPVSFLTLAAARTYASTPERLYRYHFRRGTSGHQVLDVDRFEFYLGAISSIELIESNLRELVEDWDAPQVAIACYESARLSVIGNILKYCWEASDPALQDDCLTRLLARVGYLDALRAAATFCPQALPVMARADHDWPATRSDARHVLLTTADLSTGGVQSVVVAQARYLVDAGYTVTIAVHRDGPDVHAIPDGVKVVTVVGEHLADRLASWIDICRDSNVDVVIDHHILYNRRWPFFVLAARMVGVPTIAWMHSFALRPLFDNDDKTTFLADNFPLLEAVVTLSPTDVAFWKLRGISNVAWLPNPPSPTLPLVLSAQRAPKTLPQGPIKLVWWGRLHEPTKRVRSLISITASLREHGVDAELTLVGPDTPDLTASHLLEDAAARGVEGAVRVLGPLHGRALVDELSSAHVFVSTSAVEGYMYTLTEAQALGLPVAMYELPWLATLEDNGGVVTAPQGDASGLARRIEALVSDPDEYRAVSTAALAAAERATDFDFGGLYRLLIEGGLPAEYSPEPTLDDARLLLEWATAFAESNARNAHDARRQLASLETQVNLLQRRLAAALRPTAPLRRVARALVVRAERRSGKRLYPR